MFARSAKPALSETNPPIAADLRGGGLGRRAASRQMLDFILKNGAARED
jgi:hypothetical protein